MQTKQVTNTAATIKQVIVVRKDLNMRKGKIAAQVAHASMSFLFKQGEINLDMENPAEFWFETKLSWEEREWLRGKFTKIVVSVDSQAELDALIAMAVDSGVKVCPIVDSGLTEFHGVPTLTCAAFGPDVSEKIDPITGKCALL